MPLPLEEYIEQAFFFETFRSRIEDGYSAQEFLTAIRSKLLATVQLSMAISFLLTDMKHTGILSSAMRRIDHYFTPFQAFVIAESEREDSWFDFRIALEILAREAKYRSESPPIQGLFFYQFETICRNRLGYDRGLEILLHDDVYNSDWKEWLHCKKYEPVALHMQMLQQVTGTILSKNTSYIPTVFRHISYSPSQKNVTHLRRLYIRCCVADFSGDLYNSKI